MMLNNKNASNGNLGDQQIPPPVMNSVEIMRNKLEII